MVMMRDFQPSRRITIAHSAHARNTHGTRISTWILNEAHTAPVSHHGCVSVVVQQDGQMGAAALLQVRAKPRTFALL